MDEWEKFTETSLPEKEEFYSNLNMAEITDKDSVHAKRVSRDFEIKNSGAYHNMYLKSDTLLMVDIFENVRKVCLKIYHLDPIKFFWSPELPGQALKKTKIINWYMYIYMLLIVEKGIRRGIWHAILQYIKANKKYMRDYDKNKDITS